MQNDCRIVMDVVSFCCLPKYESTFFCMRMSLSIHFLCVKMVVMLPPVFAGCAEDFKHHLQQINSRHRFLFVNGLFWIGRLPAFHVFSDTHQRRVMPSREFESLHRNVL